MTIFSFKQLQNNSNQGGGSYDGTTPFNLEEHGTIPLAATQQRVKHQEPDH